MVSTAGINGIPGYRQFFESTGPKNLNERALKMSGAWNAYNGQLTPPLKIKPGQPNDNVTVNTSRVIVDKGVSFLFGKGVKYNLDGEEMRSPQEKYLDDTWTANQAALMLHHLATNGAITGQAFVKLRIERPFIKIKVLDSTKVEVETADDDFTQVLTYTIYWDGKDRQTKRPKHYRQLIERRDADFIEDEQGVVTEMPAHWEIIDQEADAVEGVQLKPASWRTVYREIWPYPFAPIVECQNLPLPNSYWGLSDLEADIIHLNESINRALSNINRILRIHAHPKTWSKGLSESQIRQITIDPEGMIHLPGETASLQNLEMASDLASSINYYKQLREALYELSRVPKIAFGSEENVNYLAAMAMQVLYGPLIEKTETKRKTYGHLLIEVNRRILALSGQGDAHLCELVWPNVLPRDALIEAQTANFEQQAGVSRDTSLEAMGFNPDLERRRRADDDIENAKRAETMAKAQMAGQPPAPPSKSPAPDGTS